MSLEFSLPINLNKLKQGIVKVSQIADKEACSKIASRLAVDSVVSFSIDILIIDKRETQSIAAVEGSVKASIVQSCSVTQEPITSNFCIPVSLAFSEDTERRNAHDGDIDPEEDDPPEQMTKGQFDLGDVLIQILAVEINPFPRKSGVTLEKIANAPMYSTSNEAENSSNHPFAELADFKKKLEGQ